MYDNIPKVLAELDEKKSDRPISDILLLLSESVVVETFKKSQGAGGYADLYDYAPELARTIPPKAEIKQAWNSTQIKKVRRELNKSGVSAKLAISELKDDVGRVRELSLSIAFSRI